jgi:predicted AAA+ superfamily ATPase
VRRVPAKQKYPKGKRPLFVYVSEDLYNKLREIALQDEKAHGALSRVVEEALRLYLTQGGGVTPRLSAHTHTRHIDTFTDTSTMKYDIVYKAFNTVMSYIKRVIRKYSENENEVVCEVTASELRRAIEATLGIDNRTVRKYLNAFQAHKLIAVAGSNVFRVLIYPECAE